LLSFLNNFVFLGKSYKEGTGNRERGTGKTLSTPPLHLVKRCLNFTAKTGVSGSK
jgi:hypothetical protein